jgi:1-deoxy-D-xylulose-5-phosphate synthase
MFAIDRAGLVGADGPTHAGSFDLSYLRCIPNMVVMTPSDENECRQMLSTAYLHNGPSAVRYPRGGGPGVSTTADLNTIEIGKGEVRRQGKKVAILAFGSMLTPALEAAERIDATLANMRFVKPLDTDLVKTLAEQHDLIVNIEENAIMGGAGAAVMEALQAMNIDKPILCLGLPDTFIEHGIHETMLAECGLDVGGIVAAIENKLT